MDKSVNQDSNNIKAFTKLTTQPKYELVITGDAR